MMNKCLRTVCASSDIVFVKLPVKLVLRIMTTRLTLLEFGMLKPALGGLSNLANYNVAYEETVKPSL